ncbi:MULTISPECIES: hypothetical protein [Enterococcus]|uniref:hypothetical protein n=1 Tax=Enterococcus TaxID=1350 RepID=UPI000F4DF3B9|nr:MULTISPECIES: hypothetical protein [Enterococcus]MEB4785563.1 hypothetical protein [Enterococcus sp. E4-150]ROY16679.1 hypothetical protein EGW55_03990 [Enterococcus faecium]HAR1751254.1 hypothetical protein [Enterococcus faecium]
MKQTIIDALSNQKQVIFVFDKEIQFTADTLVDALPNEENYIHVKQKNVYGDTGSRIINLSTIKWIRLNA